MQIGNHERGGTEIAHRGLARVNVSTKIVRSVVLALEHGEIPAHLHLNKPTPHVNWDALALRVARERQPWMAARRLAGVSSFGFGGTNAHAILEAAPEVASEVPRLPARPVCPDFLSTAQNLGNVLRRFPRE